MTTTKIQNTHQERMAYVYVRQSTPIQVMENRESTERQYRLRDRAIELGWAPSRVEVIDEDPIIGAPLVEPLRGYWSYRADGLRIVYRIAFEARFIVILAITRV